MNITPARRRALVMRTSVARLVGQIYAQASPPQQAQVLTQLLRPVGPLALVAIAAGAFGRLLPTQRWQGVQVSPDQAPDFSPQQVADLVRYVEQKSPELLQQLPQLVADPRLWMGSAAGVLLMMALRHRSRRLAAAARRDPPR